MNINGIDRPVSTVRKSSNKSFSGNSDFANTLAAETAKAEKNADCFVFSKKDTSDMTMQEYQFYIYEKISLMPKNTSKYKDNMVFITDDGYAAMKSDPEYERWALEQIRASFAGGSYSRKVKTHSFQIIGGTKEECRYESFSSDDLSMTEKEREDLRQMRLKRKYRLEKHARYIKVLQENLLKKREKEIDHIRGIYRDYIYKQKDICANMNVNKFMLWL